MSFLAQEGNLCSSCLILIPQESLKKGFLNITSSQDVVDLIVSPKIQVQVLPTRTFGCVLLCKEESHCISYFPAAVMKTMTQHNLRKKGLVLSYTCT